METWFTVGGLAVGIVSLLYAVGTNRQKAQLQRLIRVAVADLERELRDVEDNIKKAHEHVDGVRRYLNTLKRSEELQSPLDLIAFAGMDVTAAHRILKNVRKNVTSFRINSFKGEVVGAPIGETANEEI